jgi:FAD/FMN-containing dehydrogenase
LQCPALQLAIGSDKVFYSNSAGYEESASTYFAQQQGELSPYCYVKPTSAHDVSNVVKALGLLNYKKAICPFSVRGGGHHTVKGISNIDSGVAIDLGYINTTTLSSDKSIAHVGSGSRWGPVYSTLSPYGLAVVGGRGSDIGVGGLTTGGNITAFRSRFVKLIPDRRNLLLWTSAWLRLRHCREF